MKLIRSRKGKTQNNKFDTKEISKKYMIQKMCRWKPIGTVPYEYKDTYVIKFI